MTTDPKPNTMTVATGIPPHTKIIRYLNDFATKLHNLSSKVYNLYVNLRKVVTYAIEENMASNGNLSNDELGRGLDKFHNSLESYLEIKLSDLKSRLTSVFNSHGLPGNNVSVEAVEKY